LRSVFRHSYSRNVLRTFAYYGISNETLTSVPEIASARDRLLAGAIEFTVAGIVVLCVGVGLRFSKPWARSVWLAAVSFLTVFHSARLFQDYQLYNPVVLLRVVEVLFIGSLAVTSWSWLHIESRRMAEDLLKNHGSYNKRFERTRR
jgi:hypothetical protein